MSSYSIFFARGKPAKRWVRHHAIPLTLMLVATLLATLPAVALTGSDFESTDGNLVVDTAGKKDWANAPNLATGLDASQTKDDDIYGPGSVKHDNQCPPSKTGSVPPNKDDLTALYVAHETVAVSGTPNVFVYLAWERFLPKESSASAHMGFELNQGTTPCGGTSKNVVRTAGDLLFFYELEGGGVPKIQLSTWKTSLAAGEQCVGAGSNTVPCWGGPSPDGFVDLTAAGFADGSINSGSVFDPIRNTTLQFSNMFGEAAINMTAAGLFPATECKSFGRASVSSRSSGNSKSSELFDFVAPIPIEINNCATLIVEKQTNPDGSSESFGFTAGTGLSPSTFSLTDDQTQTYPNLVPGTYEVTEDAKAGWDLTSITCNDGNSSGDTSTRKATYNLEAGETVKCTFTNRARGTIVIVKDAQPDDPQDFSFSGGLLGAFTLDDDTDATLSNTKTFSNLATGPYSVTEDTPPSNWKLKSITCVDPDSGTTTSGATASIDLDAGETVTCTFVNEGFGRIVVKKTDDDGNLEGGATFVASRAGFADVTLTEVAPGVHCADGLAQGDWTITETGAPTDHAGADPSSQTVTVANTDTCSLVDSSTTAGATFSNQQLHAVLVIVCHQADDKLAASSYDDSDASTGAKTSPTSPPSGISEAALCQYVEANGFTGKEHGSEGYSINPGSGAHS